MRDLAQHPGGYSSEWVGGIVGIRNKGLMNASVLLF